MLTGSLAIGLIACNETRLPVTALLPATKIDLAKQGVKRIAIGDIQTTDQAGAIALGEDLRAALVDLQRFEILDRATTADLLKEHKFNSSGLVNETTAVNTGKFSGATALVLGSLTGYRANSQRRSPAPITDSQLRFIDRLLLDGKVDLNAILQHHQVGSLRDLTCKQGAALIDELKTSAAA